MAFWRRWSNRVGTASFRCTKCNSQGTSALFKRRTIMLLFFFVPVWYSKGYYVTCPRCFSRLKFDKRIGAQIEEQTKHQGFRPMPPAAPQAAMPAPNQTPYANSKSPSTVTFAQGVHCPTCGTKMDFIGLRNGNPRFQCPNCGAKSRDSPAQAAIPPAQSQASDIKYCANCGTSMPKPAHFCPSCGVRN